MSTGTVHIPESASSDRADRRTTWLIILAIVAVLSVAFALLLSYAVTQENGSDLATADAWVLITLVSIVPGLLVAAAGWLIWWPSRTQAPWLLLLAPACVAVVMAGVAGAAVLGGRAHDANQATISAACSAHDIEVLSLFGAYGGELNGPQGTVEGVCEAWLIFPGEDARSVLAAVTSSMSRDGWATSDTAWDAQTFTRGSDTVSVTHARSSEGTTSVSVTVVDRS